VYVSYRRKNKHDDTGTASREDSNALRNDPGEPRSRTSLLTTALSSPHLTFPRRARRRQALGRLRGSLGPGAPTTRPQGDMVEEWPRGKQSERHDRLHPVAGHEENMIHHAAEIGRRGLRPTTSFAVPELASRNGHRASLEPVKRHPWMMLDQGRTGPSTTPDLSGAKHRWQVASGVPGRTVGSGRSRGRARASNLLKAKHAGIDIPGRIFRAGSGPAGGGWTLEHS